jgi:hypothetical protein
VARALAVFDKLTGRRAPAEVAPEPSRAGALARAR